MKINNLARGFLFAASLCGSMTLWFQYHLFDFKQLGIVLAWWMGLCMFFRFLRSSGKQPIKP